MNDQTKPFLENEALDDALKRLGKQANEKNRTVLRQLVRAFYADREYEPHGEKELSRFIDDKRVKLLLR